MDAAAKPSEQPASARVVKTPRPPPARPGRSASTIVVLGLRTWLRYAVPLTVLSAIALSPLLVVAALTHVPFDQPTAKAVLAFGWEMVGFAWIAQLILVGAAAPIVRAPRSQVSALRAGADQLVRSIVPGLAVAGAVLIGGLALAVPGLVLLVLLSLTGASEQRGVAAALGESVAAVRKQIRLVAVVVAAMIVVDLAIGFAAQTVFVTLPITKRPPLDQLVGLRTFVRVIGLALLVTAAVPATILATIRARAES